MNLAVGKINGVRSHEGRHDSRQESSCAAACQRLSLTTRAPSGHLSANMTTVEVVQYHENKVQALMRSGSSEIRGPWDVGYHCATTRNCWLPVNDTTASAGSP